MPLQRQSIAQIFERLGAKKQFAFMPFIPAGYPDLATTGALLPALENAGASIIEIGLPFSDPIADGPVIQEAFTAALKNNLKMADVLATVAKVRASVSIPLVAMGSYSIVYRYGLDRFIADAKQAGIDALILPDLPPPEAESICKKVQAAGLDTILLVAPTTSPQRRKQIAALSSGFIYYLSVTGITGERKDLPANIVGNLKQLREVSKVPVCVGFGIATAEHMKQLAPHADGGIVGSAVVRVMQKHASEGAEAIARHVGDYCRDVLRLVR
jgi:tryptophan synthase alpha chain